jgi:hypothetical protein
MVAPAGPPGKRGPVYGAAMALREKLAERTQPFLEPGEQIQQIFFGQSGPSPWFSLLTYLILFAVKYRIVAVTDRAIVVLNSRKLKITPTAVISRLPRQTRIGPVSGLWATTHFTGEKMYVHKRFHKDVEAADAVLGAGPAGPAGPTQF